jgi:hypothetical protein
LGKLFLAAVYERQPSQETTRIEQKTELSSSSRLCWPMFVFSGQDGDHQHLLNLLRQKQSAQGILGAPPATHRPREQLSLWLDKDNEIHRLGGAP